MRESHSSDAREAIHSLYGGKHGGRRMAALTRDRWIRAGLEALDQEGFQAVSAERLARRLNVTRGSFYHHFDSREAFVRALLAEWEADYTGRMLAHAAQGRGAQDILARYLEIAAQKRPGREVAIRAWALQDPLVAEFQDRVDRTRLSFALSVCRPLARSEAEAERIARAVHLCLIGGQQAGDRRDPAAFGALLQGVAALVGAGLDPRD